MRKVVYGLIALFVLLLGGAVVFVFAAQRRITPPPPPVHEPQPTTERMLDTGKVVGFEHASGAFAWLGIPFAAPPEGELRWKPPHPVEPWQGAREAVSTGPFCPQYSSPLTGAPPQATDAHPVGQEDCLYLNVWAPPAKTNNGGREPRSSRPVMMWIHGGGHSIGHAGNVDGGWLAAEQDVVVVAVNYRLGPLGWFRHPALFQDIAAAGAGGGDDGDDDDAGVADPGPPGADGPPADTDALSEASGNYGTLDLIFALRWIRDNARAFGGDPNNVTIFGESAGGANVLSLLVSPLSEGLFHRAVVQSGGLSLHSPAFAENLEQAEPAGHPRSSREVLARLLLADGEATDLATAREKQAEMSPDAAAAYLREKSAEELLSAYATRRGGMLDFPRLFADGHVLPAQATSGDALFADAGRFQHVPVILGTNRDEERLFMVRDPEHVQRRLGIFPRFRDKDDYMRHARYLSDAWKVRGVDAIARSMVQAGHRQVWAYRFDWDEEARVFGFDLSEALGAAHGMEIAFVFGQFGGGALNAAYLYDEARIPQRDALSDAMMSYWGAFAHAGAPGRGRGDGLPAWTPWGEGEQRMIVFDTEDDGGLRMSDEELTYAQLEQRLAEDDSFEQPEQRCATYVRMFRRAPTFWNRDRYARFAGGVCADLDPEDLVD